MRLDTEKISETGLAAPVATADSVYYVLDDLDRRVDLDPIDPYGPEEDVLSRCAAALNAVIGLFDGR